jgi:hypothetical protein
MWSGDRVVCRVCVSPGVVRYDLRGLALFVNAAGKDFRLRSGSPCVNAGVTLPDITWDMYGNRRPRGGRYDYRCIRSAAAVHSIRCSARDWNRIFRMCTARRPRSISSERLF